MGNLNIEFYYSKNVVPNSGKSKVLFSLFETVTNITFDFTKISYISLKSIKENEFLSDIVVIL